MPMYVELHQHPHCIFNTDRLTVFIGTSKEAANAAASNLLSSPKHQFPTNYALAASAVK